MSTVGESGQLPEDFDPTQSMELVWQGQRGDSQAVNELFTRYIPRLKRILNVKIPAQRRVRIDPDDVLQETLIVANKRLNDLEIRTRASILQWLAKIADYEIKNRIEYLNAEKRDPRREQRIRCTEDSDETSGVIVPSAEPTASQFYSLREQEEIVDQQLQELEPADYREVILLRDYCDADWETIRANLKRPTVEAVQDLYHRAHKRLQERVSRFLS